DVSGDVHGVTWYTGKRRDASPKVWFLTISWLAAWLGLRARRPASLSSGTPTLREYGQMNYLLATPEDRARMLQSIGAASTDELFADLPGGIRRGGLD